MQGVGVPVLFKVKGQLRQCRADMIVRNGWARLFPVLLLRVEMGSRHGILDNLQTRMSRQQRSNSLSVVPGGTIPKQEDRHGRKGVQDKLQMDECLQKIV